MPQVIPSLIIRWLTTPRTVNRRIVPTAVGLLLSGACELQEQYPEKPSERRTYQLVVSSGEDDPADVQVALADDFEDCEQDEELVKCFVRSESSCVDELDWFEKLKDANALSATAACAPLCET